MTDSSSRQNNIGFKKSSPNERYTLYSRRDVRTCSVCENSKKNFSFREFEVHCVSVAHIINEARMLGEKKEFTCGICKFKCSSKEEMINHINAQTHEENVESFQSGYKNKNGDNSFFKKRKIQEGTDSGLVVPTKCHGYYGNSETMSDFSKISKDGGIHVTRTLRNEVINKYDDEDSHISAPRCTLINTRNLPGIRETCQVQKKTDVNNDNPNNIRCFPKQAVPIKSSRSQASNDSSSNFNNITSDKNTKEIPTTDLEPSTSNNISIFSQYTKYMESDKNTNIFTELSNGSRELKVNEEYFNNKYKNSTTKDLITSMGKVYNDLGVKKNELCEVQKDIKKIDEEFRYLYKKISENYQKNI